ncbi:carbohydrate ABC transporter permease [Brachybacterium fresconis]|uniref:Multiple sugar transport system permease protein n=1 Tax=Brachybacterium fresconis TaxID=173363 RepID=A0ABS4YMV1_9MICO|nr:sugar ABC transporter permease [Brachybacterium fresconis]MBP2409243.1 multiple sugar transport system permease protein [Brachybacterium fresconis]
MSAVGELTQLAKSRKKGGPKEKHPDNKSALVFMAPWLLGFFGITLIPMIASFALAFTDYSLLAPPEFTGLSNIKEMIGDSRLHNSLVVTFLYVFVGTPLQLIMALLLAVLLNQGLKGLSFYRSVFYLPSLLGGSVAIAILWRQMFGANGLINQVGAMLGFENLPGWVSNPDTALGTIILLHVWTFGSPMIIFLAGLRQIPEMYYEAAAVDGASKLARFFRITIPLLTPIIFFNVVLQVINAFQSFTQAFVVSGGTGGPSDSTMFYTLYLYIKGFTQFDMGYASAMAWLLLIIVGIFTAINFFVSKFWVFYDD